ncbi:hypothetical protein [Clostridium sp. ZBS14]|uniref:hypothetical protein n=1 Tax=Clostridium sp. ZBS14 TaxID=2949970 RepID=UPI00207A647B|nr:hypothetical protein [Clostridium sp. ZBS14]
MINRENEVFELGITERNGTAEVIPITNVKQVADETLVDEISILRRKQKERLNGRIKKDNNS